MQIRIEIDVKPDELRRFLGLPDVSGLQEDIVAFLRDKVGAAGEFDAAAFVRQNLGSLRKTPAWRKLAKRMRTAETGDAPPPASEPAARATAEPAAKPARARRSRAVNGNGAATARKPRKTSARS